MTCADHIISVFREMRINSLVALLDSYHAAALCGAIRDEEYTATCARLLAASPDIEVEALRRHQADNARVLAAVTGRDVGGPAIVGYAPLPGSDERVPVFEEGR